MPVSTLPIRAPWDRQPRESAQAFEAFELYRDMGPKRSLRVVRREVGKTSNLIERWSRVWNWGDRCRRYEEYYDQMKAKALHRKRVEMIERQAALGEKMQGLASKGLDMAELETASISELTGLAEKGVKIERLAYGDSTENNANANTIRIAFDGPAPKWAPPDVVKALDAEVPDGD